MKALISAMRSLDSLVELKIGKCLIRVGLFATGVNVFASSCPTTCHGGAENLEIGTPIWVPDRADTHQRAGQSAQRWELRPASGRGRSVAAVRVPAKGGYLMVPTFGLHAGVPYSLLINGKNACSVLNCCGESSVVYKFIPAKPRGRHAMARAGWQFERISMTDEQWHLSLTLPQPGEDEGATMLARLDHVVGNEWETAHWFVTTVRTDGSLLSVNLAEGGDCFFGNIHIKRGNGYRLTLFRLQSKTLYGLAGWEFKVPAEKEQDAATRGKMEEQSRLRDDYFNHSLDQEKKKRYEDWMAENKTLLADYQRQRERAMNPTVEELGLKRLDAKDLENPSR